MSVNERHTGIAYTEGVALLTHMTAIHAEGVALLTHMTAIHGV